MEEAAAEAAEAPGGMGDRSSPLDLPLLIPRTSSVHIESAPEAPAWLRRVTSTQPPLIEAMSLPRLEPTSTTPDWLQPTKRPAIRSVCVAEEMVPTNRCDLDKALAARDLEAVRDYLVQRFDSHTSVSELLAFLTFSIQQHTHMLVAAPLHVWLRQPDAVSCAVLRVKQCYATIPWFDADILVLAMRPTGIVSFLHISHFLNSLLIQWHDTSRDEVCRQVSATLLRDPEIESVARLRDIPGSEVCVQLEGLTRMYPFLSRLCNMESPAAPSMSMVSMLAAAAAAAAAAASCEVTP